MFRFIWAGLIATAGVCSLAPAETLTVCLTGCDFGSINLAIAAANNGDVIEVAAGLYYEDQAVDTLGKAITIRGATDDSGQPTSVIDGRGGHRVFQCISGEGAGTVLENLVIQGGSVSGAVIKGAGLFVDGGSPTIINCVLANNDADNAGGGVYIDYSEATFTDCLFRENHAVEGAGVYCAGGSACTFTRCQFTNNTAQADGGGLTLYTIQQTRLSDCVFTGNSASFGGGGCIDFGGYGVFYGCTFTGNSPNAIAQGLGFRRGSGTVSPITLEGCTIYGNGDHESASQVQISGPFYLVGENHISRHAPPHPCLADLNGDGLVDAADLGILIAAWGICP